MRIFPAALVLVSLGFADVCQEGADAARRRELATAESLLTQCIREPSAPLSAFLLLCGVYQSQKNEDALGQTAIAAMARYPGDERFYLTAANIAGRQRRFADAIKILEPAASRWPSDLKVRLLLAHSYIGLGTQSLDAGDNETAAKYLKRGTQLHPTDAEAHLNLGRALHNLVRYQDALAAFDRVRQLQPEFPLLRFHRGLALFALGNFDESIEEMNAQIEADPGYAPARLVRGSARLSKGEFAEAVFDLEKAADGMPADANAQASYARALISLGRLADAESRLRKAMELDPSNPAPVNSLASILFRMDRSEEARTLATRAAELARRRRTVQAGEITFEKARQ